MSLQLEKRGLFNIQLCTKYEEYPTFNTPLLSRPYLTVRAGRLEGSFGKEKEYYHLKKIKARTKATEVLWIYLGIHTANALEIGRRMAREALQRAA